MNAGRVLIGSSSGGRRGYGSKETVTQSDKKKNLHILSICCITMLQAYCLLIYLNALLYCNKIWIWTSHISTTSLSLHPPLWSISISLLRFDLKKYLTNYKIIKYPVCYKLMSKRLEWLWFYSINHERFEQSLCIMSSLNTENAAEGLGDKHMVCVWRDQYTISWSGCE